MAKSNRESHSGVAKAGRTFAKQIERHLKRHAGLHVPLRSPKHITVVDARNARTSKAQTAPHILRVVNALPPYTSSIGEVARGGVQQSAQTGVIFVLESASGAAFHLEAEGIGKDARMGRVSSGETAKSLQMAIKGVHKGRKRTRLLRVFKVSGLHFSAVWAHDPQHKTSDIFAAYAPNFVGIKIGRIYRLHRVEASLSKHATQMILHWYERYEKSLKQSPKGRTNRELLVQVD